MGPVGIGGPAVESGVEAVQLLQVDPGQLRGQGQVDLRVQLHPGEVGLVRDGLQGDAVGRRVFHQLFQGQQLGHVAAGLARQPEGEEVRRLPAAAVAAHGLVHGAAAGIVRGQGQEPVAVELPVQALEQVQGGVGGGIDVAAAVVPPGLAQAEAAAGGRDELPDACGTAVGVGEGLEGTLHHRQQGDLQGHAAPLHLLDDEMQVGPGTVRHPVQVAGVALEPGQLALDAGVGAPRQGEAGPQAVPEIGRPQHGTGVLLRAGCGFRFRGFRRGHRRGRAGSGRRPEHGGVIGVSGHRRPRGSVGSEQRPGEGTASGEDQGRGQEEKPSCLFIIDFFSHRATL